MSRRVPSPLRSVNRKGPAVTPHAPTRRQLLAAAASLGVGTTTFHRALAAQAQKADTPGAVTPEMVASAEWVAGVKLTEDQRKAVAGGLTQWLSNFAALHKLD